MATYYVDLSAATNGDGTEPTPYNALTNLPTLVAGDTVKIKRGSRQRMPAKYQVTASGTANAWIVFEDYGTGELPTFEAPVQGQGTFEIVARNFIRVRNLKFITDTTWTSQDTVGIGIFGGGNNNEIIGCTFESLGQGILLGQGFAKSNILIDSCVFHNNVSDGIRSFSSSGSYTWDNVVIKNSRFTNNGRGGLANGSGISFLMQSTHTGALVQNLQIKGCLFDTNNKSGIRVVNESTPWPTLIAAGNTTPPTTPFQGLVISNNIVKANRDTGIHIQGATYSTKLPLLISNNRVTGNGANITTGNIWTGGCIRGVITKNICIGALTNGTTVGDGQGIFDDQWNDGMTVSYNFVSSNVFRNMNPDYSAYGIGIYRATNSTHVGNIIHNCRYGYVIGTVEGSTAPVMANIVVEHTTLMDVEKVAFSLWTAVPSNSVTFRKNVILRAARDVEAFTGTAGTQTWSQNYAYNVTTKYTGNNVGGAAWDHTKPTTDITKEGFPVLGGNLYRAGTYTGRLTAINGSAYNPPSIGAYEYQEERAVR